MKKTFAALTLAAILAFGSTFTFAGIIISDNAEKTGTCDKDGTGIIIFNAGPGIIIFGAGPGIIIFSSDDDTCKEQSTGIIISD